MKWLCVLLFSFFMGSSLMAQDVWKASLNGREVLHTSSEDAIKNTVILKKADLKKATNFILAYKKAEVQKGWERTIMAYDAEDRELSRQKGAQFYLSGAALRSVFKKSKTIKIYTIALPVDPELKAVVRVRSVHLCTLMVE